MIQKFSTSKSVDEFVQAVQKVLPNYKFGLQHIHNPQEKMKEKGIDFPTEVKILDICNPQYANTFLSADLSLSSVMPCKISVYDDKGQTTVALNSFVQIIDDLNPDLIETAQKVQKIMEDIIKDSI